MSKSGLLVEIDANLINKWRMGKQCRGKLHAKKHIGCKTLFPENLDPPQPASNWPSAAKLLLGKQLTNNNSTSSSTLPRAACFIPINIYD